MKVFSNSTFYLETPFLIIKNNIVIGANLPFYNFTEFSPKELIGKAVNDVIRLLRINTKIDFDDLEKEYFIFNKSLEYRNVQIVLEKEDQECFKYYFIEKSNSRFEDKFNVIRSLFNDEKVGIAVFSSPDLTLITANKIYFNTLDKPFDRREVSIGLKVRELFKNVNNEKVYKILKKVINEKNNFYEKEIKRNNETSKITYINNTIMPVVENNEVKYMIFVSEDITEDVILGKYNIDQVRINESLHKQAIDKQVEMIYQIIYDLDLPSLRIEINNLEVIDINQRAFNIIKSIKPDIKSINCIKNSPIDKVLLDFYDSEYNEHIKKAVNEKKLNYIKEKKYTIGDDELYWNILFEPIFGFNGEIEEIVIVMIDVTPHMLQNEKIQKVLEDQEEILANLSHELKTPLNVIFATAQLFKMYCDEDSLQSKKSSIVKYIDTITQNCFRLSKLVNNIVDLSKIQAGFYELNLSNYDIVYVVEGIVNSVIEYAESKKLSIIFDTEIEQKIISCDAEKIERVILNLISNAIKFSNIGDKINIEIFDRKDNIEISVIDSGIGIDKNHIDKIFDRFKQADKSLSRNAEGTGIGLSLVKAIVELHGGKISVESEFGRGSKFTILLPSNQVNQADFRFNDATILNNKQIINIELSDV
ncbi:MAG: ATP-binding protein [Clostridiaceae bacterium]